MKTTRQIIGASLSEPHSSNTTYFRSVHLFIYNLCIRIRTSLPPEAPDACAHASAVLNLAHLYDVSLGPRRTKEELTGG